MAANGGGGPCRPQRSPPWETLVDGGIEGRPGQAEAEPEVYYIGIIDILTAWSPAKQAENWGKKVLHPLEMAGISCVPPDQYADRFEAALTTWIAPGES